MNHSGTVENLKHFKPGESGNPGGRPASRNRLTTRFINALADDFEAHGEEAIRKCREEKPEAYIKAIAALCPKEVEIKRPLQEMEDAELLSAVRALESFLAAHANEAGTGKPPAGESACELSTVQ